MDLGCGQGRHAHALAAHSRNRVHILGLDLDFSSAFTSKKGFALLQTQAEPQNSVWLMLNADCLHLPFPDQIFDVVICAEVLEHLPDYHGVLLEIRRVLKKGGTLALSVPSYWPERICWALSLEYQHDPGGHLRIFKATPLRLEIQRLGFARLFQHKAHALHAPYWWLKCCNWQKRETWGVIRLYHRFLLWQMQTSSRLIQPLEKCLNPLLGKSVVLYFKKTNFS